MSPKKHVVFTLVVVMLAIFALSINTALAGDFGRSVPAPVPDEEHPPVCHRVESFVPGVLELRCTDSGNDINNVSVKTDAKYELNWNQESVVLRVYPAERGTIAFWSVLDKNGSVTSGSLHN